MSRPPAPSGELAGRAVTATAPLEGWRRIDWRFLLPSGPLTSVAYLGPVPRAELAVLAESGVRALAGLDPAAPPSGEVDVVVVTDPSEQALAAAARAVRPGGWVAVRLGRLRARRWSRLRPAGSADGWQRRLRRRGLESTRAFWHAPDEERSSYLAPLGDSVAVDAMLRRYHGVRFGRAKSLAARALLRMGLVEVLAGHVTVLGRRPAPAAAAPAEGETLGAARSTLLLTPWFEASRHVVGLHFDPRTGALAEVTKLPRRPWDVAGIKHEAECLAILDRQAPALAGQVPRVLRLELGSRPVLAETAVRGRAVGPEVVRAELAETLRAGIQFISSMPRTGRTSADPDWFSRLLTEPLNRVAELSPTGSPIGELVSRSLDLLDPLRSADLPLVFEHGDLGHPNLLLTAHGRLAAVDWERSEPHGLPGHDLCFFLQYVAEARRSTFDRDGQRRAFDDAFTGPRAWARPILDRRLAGLAVDRRLLPSLILASWARSSAGLVTRLAPGSPNGTSRLSPDLLAAMTADRDFALWQHSVVRYRQLAP